MEYHVAWDLLSESSFFELRNGATCYGPSVAPVHPAVFMMFLANPIHKDKVAAALRARRAGGAAYAVGRFAGGVQEWRVP